MSKIKSTILRWPKRKAPASVPGATAEERLSQPLRGGRIVGVVQITDTRLCVGVARVRNGRAQVLRAATEDVAPETHLAERVSALARGLSFAKGELYVVASLEGLDMVPMSLPPARRSALQRLILGRLAAELRKPAGDLVWAASPSLWKRGGGGPRPALALAATRQLIDDLNGVEKHGYTIELLTTHEMALAAVAARLAPGRDGIYALSTAIGTALVAVGPGGPYFARRLDLQAGAAGLLPALYDEVHHSALYIHQHLRARVERLGLVGVQEAPAADRRDFPGWEVGFFSGAAIVQGAEIDDLFLAAAAATLATAQAPANLMAPQSDTRRLVGSALALLWVCAAVAMTMAGMHYLDLGSQHNRLSWQRDDLERELAPLREAARPTAETVEARARNTLRSSTELQYPVWWALMRELSLTLLPEIHVESVYVGRVQERQSRSARRAAGSGQLPDEWQIRIKGRLDDGTYVHQQETFRRWHESLLRSPFMTQLHVAEMSLTAGGRGKPDEETSPTVLSFAVTASVLSGGKVQDVLAKLD